VRFGKSAEEAKAEPSRGDGGGFMKYCKPGDNTIRILDEPSEWVYYWEHFNPGGYPFPCTNDRDTCPGCTSEVEKMRKASRKIAFNAFDGQYTNVWKVAKTVADKLENRFNRIGTVTDRDYIITMTKTTNSTDYDVEGQSPSEFDFEACEPFKTDPETLLAQAYEDAWGDDAKVREAKAKPQETEIRAKIERAAAVQRQLNENPPPVVKESDLRAMEPWELAEMCKAEGFGAIPKDLETSDDIVDWMLTKV